MIQAKAAWAYLAALSPETRWSALVVAIFLIVYLVRKFAPKLWLAFEARSPFVVADPAPVLAVLHKAFQAMPSVVLGAVIPAVLSGLDPKAAAIGALLGLVPPVQHELARWAKWIPYEGKLGKPKPKSDRKDPPDDPDTTVSIMPEPVKLVAQDRSRLHNDRPDEPAEMRGWRHHDWRLQVAFGVLLACVVSCAAVEKRLPCDESKLRAIDAEYSAKVIAVCLPRYDSKEACPGWPALQVEHRRQLKEACP